MKIAEGMTYINGSCPADYENMIAAIDGELTFENMADTFNKLFLKPNFVPMADRDREDVEEMMAMSDEEFEEEFHAINGYYFTE
jgi:hypothetical protein